MHSRIIELGNAPILPDDRMGECSVPEWFYHSIADTRMRKRTGMKT